MVYMNGGLGNQVYQYIFARYLEEIKGERVLIDDMYFYLFEDEINYNRTNNPVNSGEKKTHNGYEIDYVFPNAAKAMLLSSQFDKDVWQHMKDEIKKSPLQRLGVVRQLLYNEIDLSVLIESGVPKELEGLTCPIYTTPPNEYNSAAANIPGNIYYYGYWINSGWFNHFREKFLKEFAFKPITGTANRQYENDIKNNFAIGVHIRRGDFVRLKWALTEDYYENIIKTLSASHPDAVYFIFSDDLEWCKANMKKMGFRDGSTVFVEGNYDYKNNYIDMQLMSMCDILVEGISSFSHLAGLLNQTPGFQAIKGRNFDNEDVAGGIVRVI